MKSRIFILGFLLYLGYYGMAAKLEISHFSFIEDDQTALHQKHFNTQKQVCALIKLKSAVRDFKITANPAITASILQADNSYFLYVSPTQITFTIESAGFEKLTYQTSMFLQSARVYEMEITIADTSESKGAIYIKSVPSAEIFLNDSLRGTTPRFFTGIKTGIYKIRLSTEGYKDYINNKVVVEPDKTTDITANLMALSGTRPTKAPQATKPTPIIKTEKERRPQDNGWFGGISLGAIFPNNYPANYYNGNPQNENSFNRIFQTYPGYTTSAYEDIKNAIGHDFDTTNIGYPGNMAYNITANLGIYGGYIFKQKNRVFLSFDYHRLKTNGTLILYYDQITPGNKDNYYDKGSIHGVEDRFHINLMYSREFEAGEYTNWYLSGGLNLNNTTVRKNYVTIPYNNNSSLDPLEYNIKYTYYDATGAAYTDYVEGGIGYGISAAVGLRLMFNKFFSLDPELQFFYSNVHLNGYEQFKPSLQFNMRINLFTAWGKSDTGDSYD